MTATTEAVQFFKDHLKEWEARGYTEPIYDQGEIVRVANEVMGRSSFTVRGDRFDFEGYQLWHAYRYQSDIGGSRMHSEFEPALRHVVEASGGALKMNGNGVFDLRLEFFMGLPYKDYIRFEKVLREVSLEMHEEGVDPSWKQFTYSAADGIERTVWRPNWWLAVDQKEYGDYASLPNVFTFADLLWPAPTLTEFIVARNAWLGNVPAPDPGPALPPDPEPIDDPEPAEEPSGGDEGGFLKALSYVDLVHVDSDGSGGYSLALSRDGVEVLERIWEIAKARLL